MTLTTGLLSASATKHHSRLDDHGRQVFARGFGSGLRLDELECDGKYGVPYARGWLAGEWVRKRTYLAGVRDGLEDAPGTNLPSDLDLTDPSAFLGAIDTLLKRLYETGCKDGSNSRGVSVAMVREESRG